MVLPSPLFALERHHIVQRLLLTIADIRFMSDKCAPRPENRFLFGFWAVGNRGRDPFGDVVRDAHAPNDAVAMLAEVAAWGVNRLLGTFRGAMNVARMAQSVIFLGKLEAPPGFEPGMEVCSLASLRVPRPMHPSFAPSQCTERMTS
jgi:hypothetical protein